MPDYFGIIYINTEIVQGGFFMPFLKADTVKTDCGYKITWLGENVGKIKFMPQRKMIFACGG